MGLRDMLTTTMAYYLTDYMKHYRAAGELDAPVHDGFQKALAVPLDA